MNRGCGWGWGWSWYGVGHAILSLWLLTFRSICLNHYSKRNSIVFPCPLFTHCAATSLALTLLSTIFSFFQIRLSLCRRLSFYFLFRFNGKDDDVVKEKEKQIFFLTQQLFSSPLYLSFFSTQILCSLWKRVGKNEKSFRLCQKNLWAYKQCGN